MSSRRSELWKTHILEKLKVDTFGQVSRPVHQDPPGLRIAARPKGHPEQRCVSDSDCSPDKATSSGEDSGDRQRSPKSALRSPASPKFGFVPPPRQEIGSVEDFGVPQSSDDEDFAVGEDECSRRSIITQHTQGAPAWRCTSKTHTSSQCSSASSSAFTSAESQEFSGGEVEQGNASGSSESPKTTEEMRASDSSTACYSTSNSNVSMSDDSDTQRTTQKKVSRRVSFGPGNSDAVQQSEHTVPAYGEIYGEHPSLFEFDVDGNMIPVPDERVPVFRFPSQSKGRQQCASSFNGSKYDCLRTKTGRMTQSE